MSLENVCYFKGNLVANPELFHIGDKKTSVVKFAIIVNRRYTNKKGEKGQESTYIPLEAWDSAAEFIAKHFEKGDKIHVEATAKTERWEDVDGNKKSRTKFRVNNFEKLLRRIKDNEEEE